MLKVPERFRIRHPQIELESAIGSGTHFSGPGQNGGRPHQESTAHSQPAGIRDGDGE
jgi:hypothetical protein